MSEENKQEREAFEAIAIRFNMSVERLPSGEYLVPSARFAWEGWQARAALAGHGVPDGWKLVPLEPTEEMMLNGSGCTHHSWDDKSCHARQVRFGVWAKMLSAAPSAPSADTVSVPRELLERMCLPMGNDATRYRQEIRALLASHQRGEV